MKYDDDNTPYTKANILKSTHIDQVRWKINSDMEVSIQKVYQAMLLGPKSVGDGKGVDLGNERNWAAIQLQQKPQLTPQGNQKAIYSFRISTVGVRRLVFMSLQ